MAYKIKIKESAQKVLKKLDKPIKSRIWVAISELANQPHPTESVKMSGYDDLWRIRVGDWRIIYQIRDDEMVILIVRVGHRRDIYRRKKGG